jgi:hypothetical protein
VSLLAPLALALLALALPILALYVLRMRRRSVTVSATFLWERNARDVQANAPWQRLRRQPLLFLQLAVLAVLALALARPAILSSRPALGEVALLLDASASMQATDVAPNRFEAARARAASLIDGLAPGDRMTLVAVGGQPQVLVPATDDRGALRAGLARAEATSEAADLGAALDIAIASARQPDRQRVVFISDGATPVAERSIPGHFEYLGVGGGGDNAGIAQVGLRETATGPQLYVEVRNYDSRPKDLRLVVTSDLGLVDARRVQIRGGQGAALGFDSIPPQASWLQVELPDGDNLALDNRAWATRTVQSGPARVLLVSREGAFLERALKLLPRVALTRAEPQKEPAGDFDLYIYDGAVPGRLPAGNAFFIDPPNATELFTIQGEVPQPQPAVRTPDDPLLAYTDLARLHIQSARRVALGSWARPLLSGGSDPLLATGGYAGRRYAVLAFDLQKSDLPLQVSFPILMANLVDWLTVRPGGTAGYRAGAIVPLAVPPGTLSLEVRGPANTLWTFPPDRAEIAFADTERPGLYTVRATGADGRATESRFAVNFLDSQESEIRPEGAPPITGSGAVAAPRPVEIINDFWKPLALIALALLAAEWLLFYGWRRRGRRPPNRPLSLWERVRVRAVRRPATGGSTTGPHPYPLPEGEGTGA